MPNYGQVTPLAEPVQTAAWIPRSDVLCRKVRRVFLHHVSDPDEAKGVRTISSIYGHGEVGLSPPPVGPIIPQMATGAVSPSASSRRCSAGSELSHRACRAGGVQGPGSS